VVVADRDLDVAGEVARGIQRNGVSAQSGVPRREGPCGRDPG